MELPCRKTGILCAKFWFGWQFVVGVGPGAGSGSQLRWQGVDKNRFELFGEGLVAWGAVDYYLQASAAPLQPGI